MAALVQTVIHPPFQRVGRARGRNGSELKAGYPAEMGQRGNICVRA